MNASTKASSIGSGQCCLVQGHPRLPSTISQVSGAPQQSMEDAFFRQRTRIVPPCHWPSLTTCCSCDYGVSALIAGAQALSQLTALENAPVLFSRSFCFYQFTAGLRLGLC